MVGTCWWQGSVFPLRFFVAMAPRRSAAYLVTPTPVQLFKLIFMELVHIYLAILLHLCSYVWKALLSALCIVNSWWSFVNFTGMSRRSGSGITMEHSGGQMTLLSHVSGYHGTSRLGYIVVKGKCDDDVLSPCEFTAINNRLLRLQIGFHPLFSYGQWTMYLPFCLSVC